MLSTISKIDMALTNVSLLICVAKIYFNVPANLEMINALYTTCVNPGTVSAESSEICYDPLMFNLILPCFDRHAKTPGCDPRFALLSLLLCLLGSPLIRFALPCFALLGLRAILSHLIMCFALLTLICCALLCLLCLARPASLCFALHFVALLCFALLCSPLLCFAVLCGDGIADGGGGGGGVEVDAYGVWRKSRRSGG